MDIEDEINLSADVELVEQLQRLESLGVSLRELRTLVAGVRTLMLVDKEHRVLLTCLVRLEPLEQVREMLNFYEQAILAPHETRH